MGSYYSYPSLIQSFGFLDCIREDIYRRHHLQAQTVPRFEVNPSNSYIWPTKVYPTTKYLKKKEYPRNQLARNQIILLTFDQFPSSEHFILIYAYNRYCCMHFSFLGYHQIYLIFRVILLCLYIGAQCATISIAGVQATVP